MVHMGTPNSRHLYAPISADAAASGLRLISYDRADQMNGAATS
jgi:hypothetical protein